MYKPQFFFTFICQSGMAHEGYCMNFPTRVGNLKASTVC